MADKNPLDISLPETPVAPSTSGASSNPLDLNFSTVGNIKPPNTSTSSNPLDFPSSSPENGQSSTPSASQTNPDDPWYRKAWTWANTPLTESLLGLPEYRQGAGGFERGLETIASGFTSPLSLALTLATFGSGGLIESAGASALKEAGLSAEQIANAVKGSEVAAQAMKDAKPLEPVISEALANGGHDIGLLNRARSVFGAVSRDAELAEPGTQEALSKIGLNPEQRELLAKGELSPEARNEIAQQNGGFSDDELKQLADTGKTVQKATQEFSPVEDAVRKAGVDVDQWKQAQDILYKNGMTSEDLLGGNLMSRGAYKIIRSVVPSVPVATSLRAAKTATTLLNGGFTYQQLETAAAMSPRFLDALKEGDYDKAWEYGTEAGVSALFGVAGGSHFLHSAGDLFKPLTENTKFRPNDEWRAIDRINGDREAAHAVGEAEATNIRSEALKALGYPESRPVLGESKEDQANRLQDYATTELGIHTGGDAQKAGLWYNALAEAAGKEDRVQNGIPIVSGKSEFHLPSDYKYEYKPLDTENPVSGVFFHGTKTPIDSASQFDPGTFSNEESLYGIGQYLTDNPKVAESYAKTRGPKGQNGKIIPASLNNARLLDIEKPLDPPQLKAFRNILSRVSTDPEYAEQALPDGTTGKDAFQKIRDEMSLEHYTSGDALESLQDLAIELRQQGYDGLLHEGGQISKKNNFGKHNVAVIFPDFGVGKPMSEVVRDISPENGRGPLSEGNGLPSDIQQMIADNKFKSKSPEYQNRVLTALKLIATDRVPDHVKNAIKYLRTQEDNNYELGSAHGLLDHYIDDHMKRVWKDRNPEGKVVVAQGRGGRFSTRVTEAQHRVYDSTLTGLLKSPEELYMDPINSTSEGRKNIIQAAANKQFLQSLRDTFTRGSDGRPAVVLSGSGRVLSGPNGEDPTTFIRPNQVNLLPISDGVLDHLTRSGDLARFLDEGTIRDITPYVRPDNIGAAIDRLEEQAGKKEAQYDEVGNNKLRTQIMYLKSMMNNKDFSGLKEFNDSLPKKYAWDPQDYITINNPAMRGWKFVTNDAAGNKIMVNTDLRVHPEYAEYLKNRLGLEKSAISQHPIGKAALGVGSTMKHTLLSLSPFHMAQEAMRAVMIGVNPLHITGPDILNGEHIDPSDPNSPTIIKKAVEHGFTPGTDYKSMQEHSEGVATGGLKAMRAIPGIGNALANSMDFYQNFLFKRYIPALKARAVELLYHKYQDAHPDWSVDRVAKAAALHSNELFGGINWQAMGRSATTQDWFRLMALAPDWLESEMRSGTRLFNREEGGVSRMQVARMALGMWGIARVLNLITTGKPHLEAPFGLAHQTKEGKEIVYSIRTLPTDLLHAATDPVDFLMGRLSPTLRTGEELVSGRDRYGRKLAPSDLWADVFHQALPIPIQSVRQAMSGSGPNVGNAGQVWKAVGGAAMTYQTPAQKMAADLAANHTEDGPVDPAQMARHRVVMNLEDRVRSGEIPLSDLVKMTYQTDQLKVPEFKKIENNLRATRGLDASMAALYGRASRLPAQQYLQLYQAMNPSERTALMPLTKKVFNRYLSKAKEMTPRERAEDPTLQTILGMVYGRGIQTASR